MKAQLRFHLPLLSAELSEEAMPESAKHKRLLRFKSPAESVRWPRRAASSSLSLPPAVSARSGSGGSTSPDGCSRTRPTQKNNRDMFSRCSPVEVEGKAERPRSAITFDNLTRSKEMKRITFALATALILGALTIALPRLRSNVQANPVAKPAAPQIGPDHCGNVKFQFVNNL